MNERIPVVTKTGERGNIVAFHPGGGYNFGSAVVAFADGSFGERAIENLFRPGSPAAKAAAAGHAELLARIERNREEVPA